MCLEKYISRKICTISQDHNRVIHRVIAQFAEICKIETDKITSFENW